MSDTFEISTGVPQGLVPGSLPFLIYINGIAKSSNLMFSLDHIFAVSTSTLCLPKDY